MALWPNGNVSTLTRGRFSAGAGPLRGAIHANNGGDRFNRYTGTQWSKVLGAAPGSGHYAGSAWVLPMTAGAVSSSTGNRLTMMVSSMSGTMGVSGSASVSATLTVNGAQMLLTALLEGSGTLTLTVSDAALGSAVDISGSTSAAISVGASTLGALAGMFADTPTCTLTDGGTLTATGALAGDILPYTELSPENLAAAVWNAIAADFNDAGTMGEKLNDAGSAGNPWATEILPGFTAERMVNIIAAAVAGKVSGGPTSPVFRNLTDTADQITGTADSNGNRTSATYGA